MVANHGFRIRRLSDSHTQLSTIARPGATSGRKPRLPLAPFKTGLKPSEGVPGIPSCKFTILLTVHPRPRKRVVPRKSVVEAGKMNGMELDKPYLSDATVFTPLSWSVTRKAMDGKVMGPIRKSAAKLP